MSLKRYWVVVLVAFALAGAALAARALPVLAIPPAPVDIPVTQPDGTQIVLRQWGDEWQHGWETPEGYTVMQSADGAWVYAGVDSAGGLVPLEQDGRFLVAGKDAPVDLAAHARPAAPRPEQQERLLAGAGALGQNIGTQPMLLVLVYYDNNKFTYPYTTFQSSFFGASNSISDYYAKASFNKLNLGKANEDFPTAGNNDGVIGWLKLSGTFDNTLSWKTIAREALKAADPYINFAQYDRDGDTYVTSAELHTIIVVAGFEQAYCGAACTGVWAHQSTVDNLILDGRFVATGSADGDYGGYAMFGETHGINLSDPNKHAATIGVMVHELGHDLSWPDLYDTNGSIGGEWAGAGYWSVMGTGSWNKINGVTQPGGTPAMPDAFLKAYQNWITPTVAGNGSSYTLPISASSPYALQLGGNPNGIDWNFFHQSGTGEYWLVENRQLTGYDAGLPGCGLLIWHVDETVTAANTANATRDKPLLAVEEADQLNEMYMSYNRGNAGDPFPGSASNLAFGNFTNPNSRYHTTAFSEHSVSVVPAACSATTRPAMQLQYHKDFVVMNRRFYLPAVENMKQARVAAGKVTYKGAAAAGVTIFMETTSDDWQTSKKFWTRTDTNGNYSFGADTPQVVDNLRQYIVYYDNPEETYTGRLAYWNCTIRTATAGSETCDIETQDITHHSPDSGVSVNLPYELKWNRRVLATDSYELNFLDADGYYACWTGKMGYVSSFTMNSLTSGLSCIQKLAYYETYYRLLWVYGANGYGVGWYSWAITFKGSGSPGVEAVPVEMVIGRRDWSRMNPKGR